MVLFQFIHIPSLKKIFQGPFLISLAACLWATDALIRYPALHNNLDPFFLVLFEHLLGVLLLFPWFLKNRGLIFKFHFKQWAATIFTGICGSALGTIFFTLSFLYLNPSIVILLQKLQPLLVVFIAYFFLGERPSSKFYFWAVIAFLSAVALSIPQWNVYSWPLYLKGLQYALGAMILWSASTITSKFILNAIPPHTALFLRFFFGLIPLILYFFFHQERLLACFSLLHSKKAIWALTYLCLVPGIFAMLIYYYGLNYTPASTAIFIELLYPIAAIILNTTFLHVSFSLIQIIAGTVLIFSIFKLSFSK